MIEELERESTWSVETLAKLRCYDLVNRAKTIGDVNRAIVIWVANRPGRLASERDLCALFVQDEKTVDAALQVRRALSSLKDEELFYRAFFLVSIGLLEEVRRGNQRCFRVGEQVAQVVHSLGFRSKV